MNLLIVRLTFWKNQTLNPGTIVEVSDRGLMAAMIGSGRALAADPETAAEYAKFFEPAPSAVPPRRIAPSPRARPGAKPDRNGFWPAGTFYER